MHLMRMRCIYIEIDSIQNLLIMMTMLNNKTSNSYLLMYSVALIAILCLMIVSFLLHRIIMLSFSLPILSIVGLHIYYIRKDKKLDSLFYFFLTCTTSSRLTLFLCNQNISFILCCSKNVSRTV